MTSRWRSKGGNFEISSQSFSKRNTCKHDWLLYFYTQLYTFTARHWEADRSVLCLLVNGRFAFFPFPTLFLPSHNTSDKYQSRHLLELIKSYRIDAKINASRFELTLIRLESLVQTARAIIVIIKQRYYSSELLMPKVACHKLLHSKIKKTNFSSHQFSSLDELQRNINHVLLMRHLFTESITHQMGTDGEVCYKILLQLVIFFL